MVTLSLKALILAGGFGTRLRPLSCTRPKILFPIINKPMLQWTFEKLSKSNIKEVILAVNYQTEAYIKMHKIPKNGLSIRYSRDPFKKPLGTGGPIKKAEKLIGYEEPFLVLNGDIFADVNYAEIVKVHKENSAVATIALHTVEDPSRYGVAELTKENRIIRFIEKPPREKAPSNLINAGVYVLSPKIFSYIPKGRAVSLEREVFPKLADEGVFYGYVFDGLWTDIGKTEDYLEVNKALLYSFPHDMRHDLAKGVKIEEPVAFGERVTVGENSVIGPYAVLGQGVSVGKNVCIENSVIFPNTVISDYASISDAIIGEGTFIGKRVKIGKGCVLGDYVKVKDNVSLAERVSVCPAKEVSENITMPKCII